MDSAEGGEPIVRIREIQAVPIAIVVDGIEVAGQKLLDVKGALDVSINPINRTDVNELAASYTGAEGSWRRGGGSYTGCRVVRVHSKGVHGIHV